MCGFAGFFDSSARASATEMEAAKLDPENPEFQSRLAHFREAQTEPPPQKP